MIVLLLQTHTHTHMYIYRRPVTLFSTTNMLSASFFFLPPVAKLHLTNSFFFAFDLLFTST